MISTFKQLLYLYYYWFSKNYNVNSQWFIQVLYYIIIYRLKSIKNNY